MELGEDADTAAKNGANEVRWRCWRSCWLLVVVFFPVTFLFGVSKYLFGALALAVVLALFGLPTLTR
jgi:multidrug efflux pump subunit AcrB